MARRPILPLFALAAIWGSSYVFIAIALRGFDPIVVAGGRQCIAAVCLLPVAIRRRTFAISRRDFAAIAAVSVVMVGGPTVLVAVGQQSVPSSLAGTLVATSPVFTVLLAIRIDQDERPSSAQLLALLLGLIGIGLLFGVDLRSLTDGVFGGLALLLAAFGYALGGLLVKRLQVRPVDLTILGSLVSGLLLLPAALVALPDHLEAGPALALLELGAIGTAAGWVFYYSLISRYGARRASVVQYLAPAFAVVLGVAALSDPLTPTTVLGLAMVLAASFAASAPAPDPVQPPRP